ncbi:putative polygalacturonase [Sesbania bispinosa]|nr:putative polygalacturonase [Sesbania bispinosa]
MEKAKHQAVKHPLPTHLQKQLSSTTRDGDSNLHISSSRRLSRPPLTSLTSPPCESSSASQPPPKNAQAKQWSGPPIKVSRVDELCYDWLKHLVVLQSFVGIPLQILAALLYKTTLQIQVSDSVPCTNLTLSEIELLHAQ